MQNLSHDFADTDPAGAYHEIRSYARDEALRSHDPEVELAFARARRAADDKGLRLRLPATAVTKATDRRPGCTWPWDAAYITSRGVVQPCCMVMGDDRVSFGRLTDQSFTEIWNSAAYQDFRAGLLNGRPPEVCRGCALYQGSF